MDQQKLVDGQRRYQQVVIALIKSPVAAELIELLDCAAVQGLYQQTVAAVMQKYDLMNGQAMDQAKLEEQKPALMLGLGTEYWMESMANEKKEQFQKGELSVFELFKMAMDKLFVAKGEDEKWKRVKKEYNKAVDEVEQG